MSWRNGFNRTKFVGIRKSSGWSVPAKPVEEGTYLLDIDDTGKAGWRKSDEGGGLVLGETEDTAFRGDHGKEAYDHVSSTDNPHSVTAEQVGAAPAEGDCEQRFSVKKATEDCHAINKLQFDTKIDWLIQQDIDCGNF